VIRVLDGGLSTTVQDAGRFGLYHLGVPPSGALDGFSYRLANLLVGNPEGAAVLEATYAGPKLEFTQDAVVAVTGADLPPALDGEERPEWEAFAVDAGQVLRFGYLRGGARAYIAVAGGIDVPEVLGSRSTYTLTGVGGYEGRALKDGDELPVGEHPPRARRRIGASVDERDRPRFSKDIEVRLMLGLCAYRLTEESTKELLATEWTVTPDADRVGYRYKGIELRFVERKPPFGAGQDPSNVVDVGYPVGSIQVPGGVEPILLLKDAVTGGGYATIGTVISADLDRVAQSKTNERTRFRCVGLDEALQARAQSSRRLVKVRSKLES
jgi:biotin-dependent carboxylase-like uncharacterized protein